MKKLPNYPSELMLLLNSYLKFTKNQMITLIYDDKKCLLQSAFKEHDQDVPWNPIKIIQSKPQIKTIAVPIENQSCYEQLKAVVD